MMSTILGLLILVTVSVLVGALIPALPKPVLDAVPHSVFILMLSLFAG